MELSVTRWQRLTEASQTYHLDVTLHDIPHLLVEEIQHIEQPLAFPIVWPSGLRNGQRSCRHLVSKRNHCVLPLVSFRAVILTAEGQENRWRGKNNVKNTRDRDMPSLKTSLVQYMNRHYIPPKEVEEKLLLQRWYLARLGGRVHRVELVGYLSRSPTVALRVRTYHPPAGLWFDLYSVVQIKKKWSRRKSRSQLLPHRERLSGVFFHDSNSTPVCATYM